MSFFTNVEAWGNEHRPVWLDYVRILAGLFITYKGMLFMTSIESLRSLIGQYDLMFASIAIAHYVIFVHVLGGALIVCGLYTRAMAVLQLPILLGAVFLVNYPSGFLSMGNHMELEMSIITLVVLIILTIFGAGRVSIDHLRRKDALSEDELS